MVRLLVKKITDNQFLYDTTVDTKIDDIIKEITIIHNGRLKVTRLTYDLEELANHGTMLPQNMQGLTDEQIEELHLVDEWGEKCCPSGGWTFNKDIMGRRNGKQPNEKMQNVLKKAIEDARAMISKKLIDKEVLVTQKTVQDALDIIKGAVMIVYPMGLPPHDVIRLELENNEDLSGTHASLEVIDFDMAQLWFSGKELLRGNKLKEFIGDNDKTKIVVKISKRGSAAPPREPVITDEDRKMLQLHAFKRQEELKELCSFFSENDSHMNISRGSSTCCIIKPHAVRADLTEKIVYDIQRENFNIKKMIPFNISKVNCQEFYDIYKGVVPFYGEMVGELNSGTCIGLEITHNDPNVDVVSKFRKLCGPMDSELAKEIRPNSLRAKYGKTKIQNAVHCSDLHEESALEVEYLFKILLA